jgi:hypothetical protein
VPAACFVLHVGSHAAAMRPPCGAHAAPHASCTLTDMQQPLFGAKLQQT